MPNDYAPDTTHFNGFPIHELNTTSRISSTLTTFIQKLDPKNDKVLRKFNFLYRQISSHDIFNLMQRLSDFQDLYSQHKFDFGVVDIPFLIILKPDVESKNQRIITFQHKTEMKNKKLLTT